MVGLGGRTEGENEEDAVAARVPNLCVEWESCASTSTYSSVLY
jgi:hypothetical protein